MSSLNKVITDQPLFFNFIVVDELIFDKASDPVVLRTWFSYLKRESWTLIFIY